MGRSPCPSEKGLNRGAWTAQEDKLLFSYIMAHGEGKWTDVPKRSGLNRSGKSCRLRWLNYLKPDIKRGNITEDEEELIIRLHKLLGNRWSLIAGRLPGRTDNEIKNYWNTTLAKKLRSQSCSMFDQHPSNKSTPSQPEVTRPQVIKTKAARCRSQIVFDTSQSQCSHSSKAQVEEEDQFRGDENLLSCRNNEFELNAGDFCGDDVVCNLENSMGMDVHGHADQSLCFGELMVDCSSTASGFDVDDNATMDLDPMVLFLESGDWA